MRFAIGLLVVLVSLIAVSPVMSVERRNPIRSQPKQRHTVIGRFARFGKARVAPISEKQVNGKTPRLENVVESPEEQPKVAMKNPEKGERPNVSSMSRPGTSVNMGMVTARIIIQEEEEEKLGLVDEE
jgi:hypothetical protein